ncbi:MAG: hypothetical protein MUF19_02790 [Candidatus Pacebacteria bacterium]|jgi:hypothetical protein|nr:hypothetical protein [Candidatus Paceibacterota bacterium]
MLHFALISAALSASAYLYAMWHKLELLKQLSTPANPLATFFSLFGNAGLATLALVMAIIFFVLFLLSAALRWYSAQSLDPILVKVFFALLCIGLLAECYYVVYKARLTDQTIIDTFLESYTDKKTQ